MAKYTEEQKNAVLARIPEIGVSEAAKEAGIPVSTVSKWNKAAKTAQARELYAKAEDSASAELAEAIIKADAKLADAELAARDIVDQADKENAEAIKAEIKDKKDAAKINAKKKTAKVSHKAKEKKQTVKERVEKPIKKARAAKMELVFETNGGRQIKPEEIADMVPKGVDAAYIKLEENKIYWVKGTETGSVDIW